MVEKLAYRDPRDVVSDGHGSTSDPRESPFVLSSTRLDFVDRLSDFLRGFGKPAGVDSLWGGLQRLLVTLRNAVIGDANLGDLYREYTHRDESVSPAYARVPRSTRSDEMRTKRANV